jgi:type I restriction enzyme R subunit
MAGAQYEKKIRDYLRNHLDHLVIHRLRSNQPLTETDLQGLEQTLTEMGEEDGATKNNRSQPRKMGVGKHR